MEIYGTLGPSCGSREVLAAMFRAGMTGIRLNLSHVTLEESRGLIKLYHDAARDAGIPAPDLLVDMQGPELRIGRLEEPLRLEEGDLVRLSAIQAPEEVMPYLLPGRELLLDDGKILLSVLEGGEARVLRGGILYGRKSLAGADPGMFRDLRLPALTRADRENLKLAKALGVTGVMQPFVRGPEDLRELRGAIREEGAGHLRIFAKIENLAGVEHLPELLPEADVIVIARGDLGNAVPLPELPGVQKNIAETCLAAGKPFLVVTQMLASMEENPVPTRAEVSDIFNAILDGASAVMLTGETAVGKYPAEAVRYLRDTAEQALLWNKARGMRADHAAERGNVL